MTDDFTPRTEGQFSYDELGQRACRKCGWCCAGCTPEKCGTPCEACALATGFTDDDWKRATDVVDARDATITALQARVRELEAALEALLEEADVGARGNYEDFAAAESAAKAALRRP